MTTITGTDAIDFATRTGAQLNKHADPVDGAREITVDEARAIAREDVGLVWCEATEWTGDAIPRTFYDLATWRRLGSEDAAEDAARGHVEPLQRDDLVDVLAVHHVGDLDRCADDAARDEAIDALVEGYLHGG